MAVVMPHIDIDVSYLSEHEQAQIQAVVERDELLRQQLLQRIQELQSEVEQLKQQQQDDSGTLSESRCARCHQELSLFNGADARCPRCLSVVCDNSDCRRLVTGVLMSTPRNTTWICILCYKEIELRLTSGEWLHKGLRRQSDEESIGASATDGSSRDLDVADGRDRVLSTVTDRDLALSIKQFDYADESWDVISTVLLSSNCLTETDTVRTSADVDITSNDNAAASSPRVDDTSPHRDLESSRTTVEAISFIHDESDVDQQIDDVDDSLSAHSSALNTSVASRQSFASGSQDSIASAYSDWGLAGSERQRVNVSGEVCFLINHNSSLRRLEVVIQQCRNLAAVDRKKKYSNPYVKVYLLPDKSRSGKRKTRVMRKNLNPVYEETLTFETDDVSSSSILARRTVWLAVWHSDRFGHNVFLGDVIVPLYNYEFEGRPISYPLQQQGREKWKSEMILTHVSELELSLEYVEQTTKKRQKQTSKSGDLHIAIKQAFNLMPIKASGVVNAFCKIRMLSINRRRKDHHKTTVVNNSQDPAWNQKFTFTGVTLDQLRNCCGLEISVWDYERFTTSNFLGAVHLNSGTAAEWPVKDWTNAEGNELATWQHFVNEEPATTLDARLELRRQ